MWVIINQHGSQSPIQKHSKKLCYGGRSLPYSTSKHTEVHIPTSRKCKRQESSAQRRGPPPPNAVSVAPPAAPGSQPSGIQVSPVNAGHKTSKNSRNDEVKKRISEKTALLSFQQNAGEPQKSTFGTKKLPLKSQESQIHFGKLPNDLRLKPTQAVLGSYLTSLPSACYAPS